MVFLVNFEIYHLMGQIHNEKYTILQLRKLGSKHDLLLLFIIKQLIIEWTNKNYAFLIVFQYFSGVAERLDIRPLM